MPDDVLYQRGRLLWAELLHAPRTRLAVFEPQSPVRQPLVLTEQDGLGFTLRDNATLEYPVAGPIPPLPQTNKPPAYFTDDGTGLKGGWSWGFESRNVLQAVSRQPAAVASSLSQLFFSALGGWGQQRAVFDNGLSIISAHVEMGRTSTIVIERIGRISVFWNRAKHVVVYDRTVAASRQFFNEQYPLTGNPVLRKVDEYIEILETDRPFPDAATPAVQRGFVVASRFPGGTPPRIRVNSRWGSDVGDKGWKIPLWVRGAAPADVYPKPSIYALAEGLADERVPLCHDDPDKLFFYTAIDEPSADTDTWAPVEGVDFQTIRSGSLNPPQPSQALAAWKSRCPPASCSTDSSPPICPASICRRSSRRSSASICPVFSAAFSCPRVLRRTRPHHPWPRSGNPQWLAPG
jgi:hypothetical protein